VIPLTLAEVRRLCPGELRVAAGAEAVSGVQVDSRRVEPGDLFVAVGGGAGFREDALARGAAAALNAPDPFAALGALAGEVRRRSHARVVAITGSTGKTSTKDILAALARPHARTVAAEAGYNNEIGLPLTVLRTEPDTEIVITEMGMRGLGQIAALCAVARPHVGVVTSVGPVHLELLGTIERIGQAKAEVIAGVEAGGTGVVPVDAPQLAPFLGRRDISLVRVGPGGDVSLERFEPPLLVADVGGRRVELEVPFSARHHARNTVAALAAYRALGLPLDRVGEGAAEVVFSRWRGEEHELPGGGLLINDAWNANPVSMRAALEHLAERAAGRRTVAVLGEMAELGPEARRYHRELAGSVDVDVLVTVGELAREYGAGRAGERHAVATAEEAAALVRELLVPGDAVLVKASRVVGLEAVAEALTGVPA
jgi:UDP-N-acetylmuramoyl-tripeptide--D-alanyl-D-alanine ligase